MSTVSSNGATPLKDGIGPIQAARFRAHPLKVGLKKPMLSNWVELATDDPMVGAEWAALYPNANLGVALGFQPSNGLTYFVIDLDTHDGRDGAEVLLEYAAARQVTLPRTLIQRTGGGGRQLFYYTTGELHVPNHVGKLQGVDVRGDGGQVVVPPSIHPDTGLVYYWEDPSVPMAEAPTWLLELVEAFPRGQARERRPGGIDQAVHGDPIPEGERNNELFRIASRLRNRGMSRNGILGHLFDVNQNRCDPPLPHEDLEQIADSASRYEPEPELPEWPALQNNGQTRKLPPGSLPAPPGWLERLEELQTTDARDTDRYNGLQFATMFDGQLIFTPEAGWLVWTGKHWRVDDLLLRERMIGQQIHVLRKMIADLDGDQKKLTERRIARLEGTGGMRGCLQFASSEMARHLVDFDSDPWVINFQNGTLDLRTLQLRPHSHEDLITRICPVDFDPEARDDMWDTFLLTTLPDDEMRRTFQAFMGSCLTGVCRDKAVLIPFGESDTGKSTAVEPCVRALGSVEEGGYAASWPSDVVERARQVNVEEKKAQVRAARLVVIGELTRGSRFNDGFVKSYSGGDTVSAKALYKGSFSYRPQAKLVMHTNYVPRSSDRATQNRLKLLPFRNKVLHKDEGVKTYLETDPKAQTAIAAWMVAGCLIWQQEGLGKMPWLEEYLREYDLDSNPVAAFVEESLEPTHIPDEFVPVERAWQLYQAYEAENALRPRGRRSFNAAMEERGFFRQRVPAQGGNLRWGGLRIKLAEPFSGI